MTISQASSNIVSPTFSNAVSIPSARVGRRPSAGTRRRGDRGSVSVSLTLLVVVVLAGGGLIFDGATYLATGRHASNVGEGAARAAVATGSPDEGLSEAEARAAAVGHATSLGIPAGDVAVSFPSRTTVVVTITARRQTSLIQLFGSSSIAVTSSGQAELTFR